MKKYPKYKDSGVEWIGKIPSQWEKKRIRNIGVMYGGLTGKSGDDFRRDEDDPSNRPFIPFTNICNNTYINKNELKLVSINENDNQNRVQKHDLFFMMTSETQNDVGKTSVLREDLGEVYLNTFCKGFRITDQEVDPFFLNYLLNGKIYRELISVEGNGYTRINLRQDRVNEFIVLLPPLPEQQQIVTYLDHKTTLIDQIISGSEKKIELLKEQRTATINHAVTKGLNPKVKMKDSGVEWIGQIPSHWGKSKISYYIQVKDGTHTTPDYVDVGYPLVTQKDITNGKLDFTKTRNISEKDYLEINKRSDVVYGDIIMSMIGSIGNPTIVDSNIPFSIKNVCLFKTSLSTEVTKYVHYFLQSEVLKRELEVSQRGGVQGFVSLDVLRNLKYVKPPILEQEEIVEYIDTRTTEIDKLISIEQRRIELMKEYRQSLISEVVTGKIKVTNE